MNAEINELLSYYLEEKALIDSLIKEDLINHDYKSAWLHSKSLGRIENQIRLLKSLIDPQADEKERLSRQSDFFIKRIESNKSDYYTTYMLEQIDKKLKALNNLKPHYFNDGQEFDDAIFELIEGRINSFTIQLKKSGNLYLNFSIKSNYLKIKLTPFSELLDNFQIGKFELINLKHIGFRKNKSKKRLQYKYPLSAFKDSIFIKEIVSRVVYDVFFHRDLDKITTLEIKA